MTHREPERSPYFSSRTLIDCNKHHLALTQAHQLYLSLHARTVLDQHELTNIQAVGVTQQHGHLDWKNQRAE